LHDVYCRLVRLRSAREPVPLVRAISSRYPRGPRRHLFTAFDTRLLVAQLVLFGTSVAILSLLRGRTVAVPRPLSNASAALGRTFAPRAPSAPAGLLHGGWRDCKRTVRFIDTVHVDEIDGLVGRDHTPFRTGTRRVRVAKHLVRVSAYAHAAAERRRRISAGSLSDFHGGTAALRARRPVRPTGPLSVHGAISHLGERRRGEKKRNES